MADSKEPVSPGPRTRPADAPVVEVRSVVKTYPGVRALDSVNLALRPGRVHALLGENGAGKSTLVKVLTGSVQPDGGELRLDGETIRFTGPRDALARGVMAVHQELTVLPAMSVADNVLLGQERSRRGVLARAEGRRLAREALDQVGLGHVRLDARAETLSLASRQMVEIARALLRRSRLLILDEPSAVLAGDQLQALFALVRKVRAESVAVLYISHRLDEITELADDVTVLRDGTDVSTGPVAEYDIARMVRDMVGRDVEQMYPQHPPEREEVVLSVRDLVPAPGDRPGVRTAPADGAGLDLEVRAGEVVGVTGLLGSGRSRLLRTIAGAHPRARGTVHVGGTAVSASFRAAIRAGMAYVPEERKTEGLVLGLSVSANTTLADLGRAAPRGWLSPGRERRVFEEEQGRLAIRASGPDQAAWQLSGGNQQKIVLAKWLRRAPRVLLLDEPTRGIDVGARAEIYRIVTELAASGVAVVFVSSDLPEVIGLARRVLVCRAGGVVGELAGEGIDEEHIMHLALGTAEEPV